MLLNEGDAAPKFVAKSTCGEISLNKLNDHNVVLYFYPKDMTPGCTVQAQEFSSLYSEFQKLNTIILGVSKDTLDSHHKFCDREDIRYPLLLDIDYKICNLYGTVKQKSMFGKKYMGIARTTFLINKMQKIVKIWDNVKPKNHAQNVLDTIYLLNLI